LDNSISLASKIENAFEGLNKRIRGGGVKQAPFMVLQTYMPRVLVEMGFISNYVEEIYWTQSQVRMKLPLRLLMQ
jgi:N-acetylmuramoyl-L-alanine amidase